MTTVNRPLAIAALAALVAAAPAARAQTTPFVFSGATYRDAREAPLKAPEGVACDDAGNVVVADTGNGRLVVYRHVAGALTGGTPVQPAGMVQPVRAQFDSKGRLLVLDARTRRILTLDLDGKVLAAVEPRGGAFASMPVAFKLDAQDALHVVDAAQGRVNVIDASGAVVRHLDLPKGAVAVKDVHVDLAGNVYVVDGSSATVWMSEKGAAPFKPFTASMKDRMNFPTYLTGGRGRFFLVDQFGNGVVVLGADGAYQGRQLAIGWNDGLVYYPSQLCVTTAGDAFLADRGNDRVQVFNTRR